jgi:hypothetical protein
VLGDGNGTGHACLGDHVVKGRPVHIGIASDFAPLCRSTRRRMEDPDLIRS